MKMAEMELKKFDERRQHSANDDEPEQKRQKPDGSENDANAVEPKTITNIYYDCLERIFDFLDIESLLMVANTCKRLQIAAAVKFGDEFGEKIVCIYSKLGTEAVVIMHQNKINVYGLKLSLPLLRCFGAKISQLVVNTREDYVQQYVNQYCADTLTAIVYNNRFLPDSLKKPFKLVERAIIRPRDRLNNQLTNFVNCFPNLRDLAMEECRFEEIAPVNVHFPHLERLQLYIHMDSFRFGVENVVHILQASPQLQSLTIWSGGALTLSMVLDAISANPFITKLEVVRDVHHAFHESFWIPVNAYELNRFVAEHPLVEELILNEHRLTAVDAINFIRQMKSLKRIKFRATHHTDHDRMVNELNNEWAVNHGFYTELTRK